MVLLITNSEVVGGTEDPQIYIYHEQFRFLIISIQVYSYEKKKIVANSRIQIYRVYITCTNSMMKFVS